VLGEIFLIHLPKMGAIEESSGRGGGLQSTKLPELLLIEVLRSHLANAPAAELGWDCMIRCSRLR
jgi:hypothetical protein